VNNSIFSIEANAVIEQLYQECSKVCMFIPLMMCAAGINFVVAIGVLAFEFEIMYKLFSQLAGQDDKYWSPAVLGTSAFIMVAAIHYLAQINSNHFALRILNKAAGLLIPIYLIGIGLVLASLLFNIGIKDFLDASSDSFTYEELMSGDDSDFITTIMQSFISPIAGGLFSVGIGAIAIINVFVSHHAILRFTEYVFQIKSNGYRLKLVKRHYEHYTSAKTRDEQLELQIMKLELETSEVMIDEVVGDIMMAIQEALEPVRTIVNDNQYVTSSFSFLPNSELNTKELEKSIKAIDAITFDTIKKQIKE
tara:strand:- start:3289 stop:4212 length:924 start_codon:yes stop_codon:yes gene_type:complete